MLTLQRYIKHKVYILCKVPKKYFAFLMYVTQNICLRFNVTQIYITIFNSPRCIKFPYPFLPEIFKDRTTHSHKKNNYCIMTSPGPANDVIPYKYFSKLRGVVDIRCLNYLKQYGTISMAEQE